MTTNHKFGQIIDEKLHLAPKRIIENGTQIINPTAEMYVERGYYPIVRTDMPDDAENVAYVAVYILTDGNIVQSWEVEDA